MAMGPRANEKLGEKYLRGKQLKLLRNKGEEPFYGNERVPGVPERP